MVDVIVIPPNTMPRINKIWAFLSVDDDGNEGVIAAPIPGFASVPLIAADEARLASLTPLAETLAKLTGRKIVLVEFATRTDVREIKPTE